MYNLWISLVGCQPAVPNCDCLPVTSLRPFCKLQLCMAVAAVPAVPFGCNLSCNSVFCMLVLVQLALRQAPEYSLLPTVSELYAVTAVLSHNEGVVLSNCGLPQVPGS